MQQQSARQPIDLVDTMLERELLFNDTTNANQLIAANGDKIRYVKGWGWMVYDGKRWKRDVRLTFFPCIMLDC
jgi:hypothetical protein